MSVSSATATPAPGGTPPAPGKSTTEEEEKAAAAAKAALGGAGTPAPEPDDLPEDVEDITALVDANMNLSSKGFKKLLKKETTTTTLRKVILCAIVAAIVLFSVMPWMAPALFGESLFGWKMICTIFGGTFIPISLLVGWKLGFGHTPYHDRIAKMISALDTKHKRETYIEELKDLIKKKYKLEEPNPKPEDYDQANYCREAFCKLAVDPSIYEFLHDPNHERHTKLEEAQRHRDNAEKRLKDLKDKADEAEETEKAEKSASEAKNSVERYEKALEDDEAQLFKEHGFVTNK